MIDRPVAAGARPSLRADARRGALIVIAVVAGAVVVGGAFLSGGDGRNDPAPPSSSGGAAFPVEVTLPPISLPAILATGRLTPAAGQTGSGEVTVVRQPDSSIIVRLDRLQLPGGPLAAYLVPAGSALRPDAGALLGRLTADRASHNLPVPGGAEPGPGATLLVWSESAQRPLASAVLGPA